MLHSITVLVYFEGPFWVGLFERHDKDNSAVARHVFGSEPTDAELYQFVLTEYQLLHFSEPEQNIKLTIKRKNPKRISREVRRLMQKSASDVSMTRAQEAIKLEIEKQKDR
ncbi:MAG: YjdF family protein [Coxiellaceae bacterium]|nr:MAG: YjdF family protein [Coxiellaceae bacterium]